MKNLAFFTLLLVHASMHAQNVNGIFTGTLLNDTTKKEQQYELALSEYKGKITGYSYTTFIVNDTFYYSVKRVKAEVRNMVLEVEDTKMLANNFPQAPDKGVHQVMRIPLDGRDSVGTLKGTWKTNQTKRYYTISGSMDMHRENDSSRLALVRHLYDIGELEKTEERVVEKSATVQKPQLKEDAKPTVVVDRRKNDKGNKDKVLLPGAAPAGAAITVRKEQLVQTITASTDSLVLSFYDNGIVDGDTISVYLNGVNIINKVKLTAGAVKQTIHLDKSKPVYRLVLVAENLGTIPPNTGLLLVQDGGSKYQVHFTADLQNNAAIEFKRAADR